MYTMALLLKLVHFRFWHGVGLGAHKQVADNITEFLQLIPTMDMFVLFATFHMLPYQSA